MKYTNKYGVPETIVRGAMRQNDKYDKGAADRSVTQLISPPRIDILRKKHFTDMEKDISEDWWALFGSAVHYILELGVDHTQTPEERLFLKVNGWTISGAIDLQTPITGGVRLSDYKVTTDYPLMKAEGSGKIEWEQQLNMQAYLVESNKDVEVKEVEIVAIVRNWDRTRAVNDPNYPVAPVVRVPIRLWSKEEREQYILSRVVAHQQAEMDDAMGEEILECTPEERWVKGDKWALKKTGGKRAVKTFTDREEAESVVLEPGYVMEYRPGKSLRCDYCGVSAWCTQYARMKEVKERTEDE